jgi:spermidine synthase / saccharopine dehydrogenase (NADP+, L-glutamate-forming)
LLNNASYISNSQTVSVSGTELMSTAKPYFISPAFAFVAYPNRDSVPFKEWYGIPEAETVVRGTLRYQGFPEFIKALVELGWLDAGEKPWLKEGLTWAEVMQKAIEANEATERYVYRSKPSIFHFY